MSGSTISGLDVAAGTFVLMIFSAGAALAVIIVVGGLMLRRAGQSGAAYAGSMKLIGGLALVGGLLSYTLFDRFAAHEQAAERRALDSRSAELTARSLAPGSALACLDAVASAVVENACERPLFASAEAVAAAVEYVDARFSLLAPSAALAARDPGYQPVLERLRHGLEADRYGLVAHVLMTRGCKGADCPELRLLRDPARVVANMKVGAFEASLSAHSLAWQPNGTSPAVASAAPLVAPMAATGLAAAPVGPAAPGATGSANGGSSKFDFPSANSIPAVSIMSPEPSAPPAAEPRPSTPAPKRAASAPRRPSARETAAAAPPSAPPPAPTPQSAPEAAPDPAAAARPDPHAAH